MVYLLCFDKKYKHSKHYIGFAKNEETFKLRMEHHKKGRGARLMAAVGKAGINFEVARTWPEGGRDFERKLKNRKNAAKLCPKCIAAKKAAAQCPVVKLAKDLPEPEIRALVESTVPVTPPQPAGPSIQETLDKANALRETYDKPQTIASSSRWKRLWSFLARFWIVQKSDDLRK